MSRQTMISPISVLLAGVIVILLLLAGTSASTQAITRRQGSTPTWTPCPEDGEVDDYQCEDFRLDLTDTAEAAALDATDTAGTASPTPSSTATAYPGYLPPGTAAAATTTAAAGKTPGAGTPTATRTATPTGSPKPGATATRTARAATAQATADLSTSAPTPSPTPSNELTCAPGVPVLISGSGPARAPLLLYFDQRAVGGGSAGATGEYALKLIVGQERPGQYRVTVRVRGSSRVLRELTCIVPSVAPTPAPQGRR
ncbi:MAG: hypothetical protein IPP13_08885 [Kouleothrix sp.]|jgi:hypothetical protein|nr:hypothetical protein [Kouleothrix sp.]